MVGVPGHFGNLGAGSREARAAFGISGVGGVGERVVDPSLVPLERAAHLSPQGDGAAVGFQLARGKGPSVRDRGVDRIWIVVNPARPIPAVVKSVARGIYGGRAIGRDSPGDRTGRSDDVVALCHGRGKLFPDPLDVTHLFVTQKGLPRKGGRVVPFVGVGGTKVHVRV